MDPVDEPKNEGNGVTPEGTNPYALQVIPKKADAGEEQGNSRTRTPLELAMAIRSHFKLGRQRKEILHREGITIMQYRYAIRQMGKFPKGNDEAFGNFVKGVQGQLDQVDEDIRRARGEILGWDSDMKVLPALYRVQKELRESVYEMAMKLGMLTKAADRVEITEKILDASFGDESFKPNWDGIQTQMKQ